VLPIEDVTTDRLLALVDNVLDNADKVRAQLRNAREPLRQLALRNAELAAGTMNGTTDVSIGRERTVEGSYGPLDARARRKLWGDPPLTPMAWLRWDSITLALDQVRPRRILEVGTGQGAMGWRLAQHAPYVGVEPDAQSFTIARDRLSVVPAAEVRNGDVSVVAAHERFDLVCAFEVLEHIDDDESALRAWRDRLEPGGHLLLSVPAHRDRFGACDVAVGHYRRYDRADIEAVLRATGFDVQWVRGYGAGLGHALEAWRNRALAGESTSDRKQATARSGRLWQPRAALGPVVAAGVTPFRLAQRPWSRRAAGVGYVVLAARVDG
jgi:2-polyprenyl-3-methyl-5-hydroxy-6-metoxy-1,4-benzoquinol methylase